MREFFHDLTRGIMRYCMPFTVDAALSCIVRCCLVHSMIDSRAFASEKYSRTSLHLADQAWEENMLLLGVFGR
jgi:hypothetical protein